MTLLLTYLLLLSGRTEPFPGAPSMSPLHLTGQIWPVWPHLAARGPGKAVSGHIPRNLDVRPPSNLQPAPCPSTSSSPSLPALHQAPQHSVLSPTCPSTKQQ